MLFRSIYLPRVERAAGAVRPGPKAPLAALGSETILLVEDDDGLRQLARKILQRNGYTVLEARHGSEAEQICREVENPIHLVLTDVVMPGIGGPELVRRLALLKPTVKVLYMSGYTDQTILQHGLLEMSACFLQKPFTPTSLARKVREVLDSPASE